jgi:hypothetical protein
MTLSIKKPAAYSMLSAAAAIGVFAAALIQPNPAGAVEEDLVQPVVLPVSGFRVGMDNFTIGTEPSQRALLKGIAAWLAAEFGLPVVDELPEVTLASADHITGLRFRHLPHGHLAAEDADIVAVYDDDARTIYLPDGWTGQSPAELSVLVHEMVHHLQNVGGQKFACAEERERPAYEAQDRWLGLFGGSLERDFEIDPFTLLVRTRCFY